MKHPVAVAELLELHRLGELYLKWVATPFALSEENLQELQEISDRYSINHSSALFSFQRQYQREMAVNVEKKIDEAIEAIPGLAEALRMVPATPLVKEPTVYEQFTDVRAQLDRPLLPAEAGLLQESMDRVGDPEEVQDRRDREFQAQSRAEQLRNFREELDGEMDDAREIEILRDLSNVDELTPQESERLDELVERRQLVQDSGTHKIPVGVVQDAISTGHIEKSK